MCILKLGETGPGKPEVIFWVTNLTFSPIDVTLISENVLKCWVTQTLKYKMDNVRVT